MVETLLRPVTISVIVATYGENSYYGRLAMKRLDPATAARLVAITATVDAPPSAPVLPANGSVVRALLAAEMYDDALNELRYAQRVWGDSSAIGATVAWTRQQQARSEGGMRRFQLLRGAITTMRRSYPQFMAAGGEDLPREVLTVIYPIAYWVTLLAIVWEGRRDRAALGGTWRAPRPVTPPREVA